MDRSISAGGVVRHGEDTISGVAVNLSSYPAFGKWVEWASRHRLLAEPPARPPSGREPFGNRAIADESGRYECRAAAARVVERQALGAAVDLLASVHALDIIAVTESNF